VGGLHPGGESRLFSLFDSPAAGAICYEIADGSTLALATAEGADWLLSIANLDPYPLQLQQQFLALAQLRAIESGRDLLSIANTGPTALISADGHVERLLPPMQAGLATVTVQLREEVGFYPWLVSILR
jgi:apolipoprotein N-acyltransferase